MVVYLSVVPGSSGAQRAIASAIADALSRSVLCVGRLGEDSKHEQCECLRGQLGLRRRTGWPTGARADRVAARVLPEVRQCGCAPWDGHDGHVRGQLLVLRALPGRAQPGRARGPGARPRTPPSGRLRGRHWARCAAVTHLRRSHILALSGYSYLHVNNL